MQVSLVCEGRCGRPHTEAYDAAVQLWAHNKHLKRQAEFDALLGRSLVHTPHLATGSRDTQGREKFRCELCRTVRVFGWPAAGVDVAGIVTPGASEEVPMTASSPPGEPHALD